jgi:hypothetical protein
MRWSEIRTAHPDQWIVVEALEAHTDGRHRRFDRLAVIEQCADGAAAFQRYRELRRDHPDRELYFAHTGNVELEIEERPWIGIRRGSAPHDPG